MTTVQNVGMNNQPRQQKRSIIAPVMAGMISGGVAGALSGAYIKDMPLVPPKYLTLQSFVEGMHKGDKLEISKNTPEQLQMEFAQLWQELHQPSDKLATQWQLLGDKKVLTVEEFLTEHLKPKEAFKDSKSAMEALDKKIAKSDNLIKLNQALLSVKDKKIKTKLVSKYLGEENQILLSTLKQWGIIKQNAQQLPKTLTTKSVKNVLAIKLNEIVSLSVLKANIENLFDNGKITAESIAENTKKELAEKMKNKEAQAAFEKVKGFLNKSKAKGAIIWGAIGAAVVGAITLILEATKTPKTTSYPGIEAKCKQSLNTHQG